MSWTEPELRKSQGRARIGKEVSIITYDGIPFDTGAGIWRFNVVNLNRVKRVPVQQEP